MDTISKEAYMCTAMTLQSESNEIFFGRTMDFSHDIIPKFYIVPSSHLPSPKNSKEALAAGFHILGNVSIPKGAVITNRNTYDYTKYVAFINMNTCEYFYKTYDDICVTTTNIGVRPLC